jgi:hypothetical protein
VEIPWYLETDRPYPTNLTFTPTPLEVAESSIIAPKILNVFVTTNTALLQKDQRNAGNILRTQIHWHTTKTIIFVIPMLNIVISTPLKIWLKIVPGLHCVLATCSAVAGVTPLQGGPPPPRPPRRVHLPIAEPWEVPLQRAVSPILGGGILTAQDGLGCFIFFNFLFSLLNNPLFPHTNSVPQEPGPSAY